MSLYPPRYGAPPQPPYGTHYPSYGAAMPPPVAHYPPQSHYPQSPPFDPNSFRRDYTNRLAELTFNSRPIIQSLSMIAQDYSHWSDIVAQCVESHIRRAHPSVKLPAFYLLDATSKNVYEPYARAFAPFVSHLFLDSYYQVDHATRSKMEEMLITWRTGGPQGRELFGPSVQTTIEQNIWGSGSGSPSTDHVSKAQVLAELDFTLEQKRRALHVDAYDTTAARHIDILEQLRRAVEAGVSASDLGQILAQLRTLSQPPSQSIPTASVPNTYASFPTYQSTLSNPPVYQPPPPVPQPLSFAPLDVPSTSDSLPGPSSTTTTATSTNPVPIANILDSLFKAGVVSIPGLGAGPPLTSPNEEPKPVDPATQAIRSYRERILSHPIRLTSSDITKQRPSSIPVLYDNLPMQCKQCGIRFADDSKGKQRYNDHLDMHFRQNRKANQNVGRGHSRSWFVGVDDWTHDVRDGNDGGTGVGGPRPNAKVVAKEEAAKRDAELRASHVVVPPGEEAKPIACPICKETLKSEFLEDEEEWVWKNAVKKDDRIYHATCHAEAKASTSLSGILAARMRNGASRSRSATPDVSLKPILLTPPRDNRPAKAPSASPPPSSTLGTKRKAEEELETSEPGQKTSTPPLKKVAIASTAAGSSESTCGSDVTSHT